MYKENQVMTGNWEASQMGEYLTPLPCTLCRQYLVPPVMKEGIAKRLHLRYVLQQETETAILRHS